MALNVDFECPSKHDTKPFRCSFMDGVMLYGFLPGGVLLDLTCPPPSLFWLNGVTVSILTLVCLNIYFNVTALFHHIV